MTIIEALRSGRPFRRPMDATNGQLAWWHAVPGCEVLTLEWDRAIWTPRLHEVLADDWETAQDWQAAKPEASENANLFAEYDKLNASRPGKRGNWDVRPRQPEEHKHKWDQRPAYRYCECGMFEYDKPEPRSPREWTVHAYLGGVSTCQDEEIAHGCDGFEHGIRVREVTK